jgi:regulator of protease activity HflC (stomatin/prohibitin superfamily)
VRGAIQSTLLSAQVIAVLDLKDDQRGLVWVEDRFSHVLPPGMYAYWKGPAEAKLVESDLREAMLDIGGQEIMTADKVTLRLNAVVGFRGTDARKAVTAVHDACQALYREGQLALRAVVGPKELDTFLTAKDGVAKELEEALRQRAASHPGFQTIWRSAPSFKFATRDLSRKKPQDP